MRRRGARGARGEQHFVERLKIGRGASQVTRKTGVTAAGTVVRSIGSGPCNTAGSNGPAHGAIRAAGRVRRTGRDGHDSSSRTSKARRGLQQRAVSTSLPLRSCDTAIL